MSKKLELIIPVRKVDGVVPARADRCETCDAGAFVDGEEVGECRAELPARTFMTGMNNLGRPVIHMEGGWAPVKRDAWCRCFAPKVN